MLERLWIKNFALISELTVEFSPGFSILTGETGAGKSILIGALGLVLGEKGDVTQIRTGEDEASVSAVVSVHTPAALQWLESQQIEPDEGAVLVKRTLKSAGRGSITIENVPVTRNMLREFTSLLFDMHGQNDHQSLLGSASQLQLLDQYGRLEEQVRSFAGLFNEYMEARKTLQSLEQQQEHQDQERELLEYAVEEIETAAPESGEDEQIAAELKVLDEYERLTAYVETVREHLHPQSGSVAGIREAAKQLEQASSIDTSLADIQERLTSSRYELEDIYEEVRSRQESLRFSPERLDELNARQQTLRQLKKKYGPGIEDVLSYAQESRERLDQMEHRAEHHQQALARVQQLSSRVKEDAAALSQKRRESADRLQPLVEQRIAQLGMPNARFSVDLSGKQDASGAASCSANGADTVGFLLSANRGEPLKPISMVASGGELSRIMLALKSVCSETDDTETLVFDEIDAGIGGTVAVAVGEHLRRLAGHRQVLCISHLASVAAKADGHIVVEKLESGERTETSVYTVTGEQRIIELARMLLGSSTEEKALEHARMLVRQNRS